MAAPVPIIAMLNFSPEQAGALREAAAVSVRRARPLLREYYEQLMAALGPRLDELHARGLVVDHAGSWLLGQVVAHVPADRVDEAVAALRDCPELRDVELAPTRGRTPQRRAGRRR